MCGYLYHKIRFVLPTEFQIGFAYFEENFDVPYADFLLMPISI